MSVKQNNIEEQLKAIRTKKQAEQEARERQKKGWYGLVYCEGEYASIADLGGEGIWLGKTDEIIPYLKKRGIDGESIDSVLLAVDEFRSEQENQSCHSATENEKTPISIPPEKSNRATFKKDPRFLKLLDSLIGEGYGIPTIQERLRENGYQVAYRTLGRWVKERRDTK